MYKKKSCGFGDATRDGNKFIFFNCMWTLPQRKQISTDKFVTNHALEDWWETDGAGFDAWTDASVFGETCEMKVVTHVGPLLAGTICSTWDARGFTICTVKAQLCFVKRTCLWEVLRTRGWNTLNKECVIFNTAIESSYLKKRPFVSLHY